MSTGTIPNFTTRMRRKYGGEPTSTEWGNILDEDECVYWSMSQPAMLDPSSQESADPHRIESGASHTIPLKNTLSQEHGTPLVSNAFFIWTAFRVRVLNHNNLIICHMP